MCFFICGILIWIPYHFYCWPAGAGESSSRQNGQGSRGWALPSTEQPQRQERTTPQFNMQGRASVDNLESVRPHTHGKRNFSSAKKWLWSYYRNMHKNVREKCPFWFTAYSSIVCMRTVGCCPPWLFLMSRHYIVLNRFVVIMYPVVW